MAFNKEITIGSRTIGPDRPTYFIAEIGGNFDGSMDKAKRLIDAAKEAGADCAKFQTFTAETIVSEGGFSKMELHGVHGSWGRTVTEVFRDVEFPLAWHAEIADYCRKAGIDFSTSPYFREAVDLCAEMKVPFIKIGIRIAELVLKMRDQIGDLGFRHYPIAQYQRVSGGQRVEHALHHGRIERSALHTHNRHRGCVRHLHRRVDPHGEMPVALGERLDPIVRKSVLHANGRRGQPFPIRSGRGLCTGRLFDHFLRILVRHKLRFRRGYAGDQHCRCQKKNDDPLHVKFPPCVYQDENTTGMRPKRQIVVTEL